MAVKYFVKNFNNDVFMGMTTNFSLVVKKDHSSTDIDRSDIVFRTEHDTNIINVCNDGVKVKVNGCDKNIDDAIDRIFDDMDEIKSIAIVCDKETGCMNIQVLMSR